MKTSSIILALIVLAAVAGTSYFLRGGSDKAVGQKADIKSAQQTEPSAPQSAMTFFVTSRNPGQGANLGGLEGADMVCQSLGAAAGEGNRVWRAYLSTSAIPGVPTVNARDRVGSGPWHNFKGDLIANSIEYLHAANNINKQTALTEKGEMINGRGDQTNLHDILTGSGMDGRAIPGEADTTCGNWTKSGEGAAMVGHHDRVGLADDAASKSWNSSHLSRGCGSEALASSGGGGLVYCFAVTP